MDLNDVISLVVNNQKYSLSEKEAASMLGYSTSRFSHIFKTETGYSFRTFITNQRFEEAKRLLKTELSIEQIAVILGYDCQNSLYKMFKNKTGMSPKEYRRNIISNSRRIRDT